MVHVMLLYIEVYVVAHPMPSMFRPTKLLCPPKDPSSTFKHMPPDGNFSKEIDCREVAIEVTPSDFSCYSTYDI